MCSESDNKDQDLILSPAARFGLPAIGHAHANAAAVIDVGSNSVRLVVYRVDGRSIVPFLNEKTQAALGAGLSETGALTPERMDQALMALKRFAAVLKGLGVRDVVAVATAAIRAASNGQDFVERVRLETGVKLRVISGAEEARLSTLGVLAGAPDAKGLVADLGGSSLELNPVSRHGAPQSGETFPLGPLALMSGPDFSVERVRADIHRHLDGANLLGATPGALYAVGGSWPAIARIDMAVRQYPLRVLHEYEMPRREALAIADFIRRQSRKSLEKIDEKAAAKRAETLPYAAAVLEALVERSPCEKVVISAYGLREGILFDRMGPALRAADPLVEGAIAWADSDPQQIRFGEALARWIEPALTAAGEAFAPDRQAILARAAAHLADMGSGLHPDHRAEVLFDLVLRAPFAGVSHAERAFLALSIHHRYARKPPLDSKIVEALLTLKQSEQARIWGAALRLGAELSARTATLLEQTRLEVGSSQVLLGLEAKAAALGSDAVQKRLQALAALLGRSGEFRIDR